MDVRLEALVVPVSDVDRYLVVSDIDQARADLIAHGVDVSEVFHRDASLKPVPGQAPEPRNDRRSVGDASRVPQSRMGFTRSSLGGLIPTGRSGTLRT